jgi:hypothetical protein
VTGHDNAVHHGTRTKQAAAFVRIKHFAVFLADGEPPAVIPGAGESATQREVMRHEAMFAWRLSVAGVWSVARPARQGAGGRKAQQRSKRASAAEELVQRRDGC